MNFNVSFRRLVCKDALKGTFIFWEEILVGLVGILDIPVCSQISIGYCMLCTILWQSLQKFLGGHGGYPTLQWVTLSVCFDPIVVFAISVNLKISVIWSRWIFWLRWYFSLLKFFSPTIILLHTPLCSINFRQDLLISSVLTLRFKIALCRCLMSSSISEQLHPTFLIFYF